ncbi:MAG: hypothetical protein H0U49_11760, partial [Parachlamydiaceae bacterium]|nr:hypothetical protein [Parachlamydiaceae bacterium]
MNKLKTNFGVILMVAFNIGLNSCSNDDSQIMSTYMEKRNIWVLDNAKLNFSHEIVLTEDERKLDSYIKELVINSEKEFLTSNKFYPAQFFSEIKPKIEISPLFQLLNPMPKGGMLHIHVFATGDATRLIEIASTYKDTYIYLRDGGSTLKGMMGYYPADEVPEGFQSMFELNKEDPLFISKVVEMITITTADAALDNTWDK